jgi:hypothetical protein
MCGGGRGREDKIWNLSRNEKSRVVSTTVMMQLCKQKMYRYIDENDDEEQ